MDVADRSRIAAEEELVSKSRKALQEIVGYLSSQLTRGWAALWVAQQIERADRERRLGSVQSLAGATYQACVESAILALARLTIAHKDSISVHYLLNCAYHSPSAFPKDERPAVKEAVGEHRALLQDIQPLVDRVKAYRDRAIAHLDKKHVNHHKDVYAQPPIHLWEIDRAFELTLVILKAYRGYLELPELYLTSHRSDILEDWAYLVEAIE
jgi:hypothetical protein